MTPYQTLNHYGFTTEFPRRENLIDPSSQRCGLAGIPVVPSGHYMGPVGALRGLQGGYARGPSAMATDLQAIRLGTLAGARQVCSSMSAAGQLVGAIGSAVGSEDRASTWTSVTNISTAAGNTICQAGKQTTATGTPDVNLTANLPGSAPPATTAKPGIDPKLLVGGALLGVVVLVVLAKRRK